jgi:molecular chaperone DnaJ
MGNRDPYEVLGVQRDASEDDLKETYHRLAMKCHPDCNQGDKAAEAKFKEVSEAYDILKNARQRAAYDRRGHAAFEQDAAPSGGGFEFVFEGRSGDFGGTGGGQQRHQASGCGADLRTHVEIALEEALDGTKRTVRVPSSSVAREDDDPGAEPESTPAQTCRGAGRAQRDRTLSVGTLAEAEGGTRTPSAGKGEAGSCGASDPGLDLGARAQPPFQCDGGDIFVHVPLRMTEAVLDVPLEAPVLSGASADVPAPPGSQMGDQSRLRSKRFLVLLILLLGGALIYAGTPSGVPRLAAHAPGPIAASVLPAPVLVEVADASIAPAAAPAPGPPALEADRGGAAFPTTASVAPSIGAPAPPEAPARAMEAAPHLAPEEATAAPAARVAEPSAVPIMLVEPLAAPVRSAETAVPSTAATSAAQSATKPRWPPSGASPAALAALLARGDALVATGDVAAARLVYQRAAALDSARAATAAGKTYDPRFLQAIGTIGVVADPDAAAAWYRKGAALGDEDATPLMGGLDVRARH